MRDFAELQEQLQIRFRDASLLGEAFTHSSYANEHKGVPHNERLEFLGDAVLQLAVAAHLFRTHRDWPEGKLTFVRAAVVREEALSEFAGNLRFGEYLRLGRGEEQSGGRERPSLLANVFEAFLGALYLDAGWEAVETFLAAHLFPQIDRYVARGVIDAKSRLLVEASKRQLGGVEFSVTQVGGTPSEPEFAATALLAGETIGTGSGRSKKEAEQNAAEEALRRLTAMREG